MITTFEKVLLLVTATCIVTFFKDGNLINALHDFVIVCKYYFIFVVVLILIIFIGTSINEIRSRILRRKRKKLS